MTYLMAVDGNITFKPKLSVDDLADIEEDVKIPKNILIDYEGLSVRLFEWVDYADYQHALEKLAKKLKKKRVRCKGGLYLIYGDDKDGMMKETESHKVSLRGGKFKPSSGKIKVIRPRGPRKK